MTNFDLKAIINSPDFLRAVDQLQEAFAKYDQTRPDGPELVVDKLVGWQYLCSEFFLGHGFSGDVPMHIFLQAQTDLVIDLLDMLPDDVRDKSKKRVADMFLSKLRIGRAGGPLFGANVEVIKKQ